MLNLLCLFLCRDLEVHALGTCLHARDDVSLVVQYWLPCHQAALALSGAREVLYATQWPHLWLKVCLSLLAFTRAASHTAASHTAYKLSLLTVFRSAEPVQDVYEEKRQEKIRNIAIIAHGAS